MWRIGKSQVFNSSITKALQPDSTSKESLKICSSADSEPSTLRWNEASVDTWCHHVFQLLSNANNEGVLVLSWIKHVQIFQNKKVVHILLTTSQIFFIKPHACFYKPAFFNSVSMLLNFLMSWATSVA